MGKKGKNDNIPAPVPPAAQQATLKRVFISGTKLEWVLGSKQEYFKQTGDDVFTKEATIVGIAIVPPPPPPSGQYVNPEVQVHVMYDDGYRDLFVAADHLVVKNLQISAIAVVQKPQLVVPE